MAISDQDLEGILRQAATLRYKGLDPNTSISLIRESVAAYNQPKPASTGVGQTPEATEITLDSAYETLCRLIESNRDLVKFGVYSWGNITGHLDSKGAKSYLYDAHKKEMVNTGYDSLVGIPSTDPNNELPRWAKRLVAGEDDTNFILGVDQAIQGEEHNQVLSDTRGGCYYRVGIVIKRDWDAYNDPELQAITFVGNLRKKNPQQFVELMDKLADRYVPFFNQGVKALETSSRQRYGRSS